MNASKVPKEYIIYLRATMVTQSKEEVLSYAQRIAKDRAIRAMLEYNTINLRVSVGFGVDLYPEFKVEGDLSAERFSAKVLTEEGNGVEVKLDFGAEKLDFDEEDARENFTRIRKAAVITQAVLTKDGVLTEASWAALKEALT